MQLSQISEQIEASDRGFQVKMSALQAPDTRNLTPETLKAI